MLSTCLFSGLLALWSVCFVDAKTKQNSQDFGIERASCGRMKLHKYRVDLFEQDYVATEFLAYKALSEEPIQKKVNYLVAPWARLINLKQADLFPSLQLKNGFTICQHVRYAKLLPLFQQIGVNVLFTPHALPGERYENIEILPFPHIAINSGEPAENKDILYSFIGCDTHEVRAKIFNLPTPDNCVIKKRYFWHFSPDSLHPKGLDKEQQALEKAEYIDVLVRSRFSLCPRGVGASTLRFWESLRAGAIPVLIADDMGLPTGFDWEACILRIAEKDVELINQVVGAVSFEQEEKMRYECLKAYRFFSEKNIVSVVRNYYKKKQAKGKV